MASCEYCGKLAITMQAIGVGKHSRRVPVCSEHSTRGKKKKSVDREKLNRLSVNRQQDK